MPVKNAAETPSSPEHFEVSWNDGGNRRHALAFNPVDAQEIARGFIEDHNLTGVQIHKVTTGREQVPLAKPPEVKDDE
jgi:hypothetical protein